MVDWNDYFKGRDLMYPEALTLEISRNAVRTIEVVNAVLSAMKADGVELIDVGVHVASGWRPPEVNDHTANAAAHSKHLTAEACDLQDFPDRRLAKWALANEAKLRECGVLGMERPGWTPTWLHLQTRSASHFCFVPSTAPPKVAALPGELQIA